MINFRQIPLIRFLFPFVLGIIFGIYQDTSFHIFFDLFIVLFFLFVLGVFLRKYFIVYNRYYYLHELVLYGSLFFGGLITVISHTDHFYNAHYQNFDQKSITYQIQIDKPIRIKPRSVQCEVEVTNLISSNSNINTCGKALLYIEKDSSSLDLLQGDVLKLKTKLSEVKEPTNPGQFNYKLFLQFHQIQDQGYVSKGEWMLIERNNHSIFNIANRCRNYFLAMFKKAGLRDQEYAVASALTLGYKDEISNETKHAYSSAGAMHVLAVSGLHVGIIYLIFNSILSFFLRYRATIYLRTFIIILILWLYALLTGLSPSVLRATTMLSFIIVGKGLNRDSNIYNSLAASAFLLLIINPYLIMQVGFQLSYLAVAGILFFQPRIYNKLQFKNYLSDKIWAITAVSLAAQISTFPLGLLYFHQFPTYFLISNLLVIPAAYLLLVMGIILLVTSLYSPVSDIIGWMMQLLVHTINNAVKFIDQLPFSLVEGISISVIETYTIYSLILFFAYGFVMHSLRWINFGLILIILLFSIDLYEDKFLKTGKQIVIYDIKNHIAVDFIKGKNHVFFSDNELVHDKASMLFNIKHHWYDLDLYDPIYKNIQANDNNIITDKKDTILRINSFQYSFNGINLVLLNKFLINELDENDVVLISGNFKGDYYDLFFNNRKNKYIGLTDLSYQQKSEIEKLIGLLSLDYYDISKNGAWIKSL